MDMSAAVNNNRKSAKKLWRRRVRLLPVAFLMLLGSSTLGLHLRTFVAQTQPNLDKSAFIAVGEKADALSRALIERSERSVPIHDLAFLEPVVMAERSIPSDGTVTGVVMTTTPIVIPPVPKLDGIMFSETEASLAVLNGKAVAKDDVVTGWRVLLIEPEKVRLINDATGTEKVVILYENEK
jgi:hypothetical protein